MAGELDRHAEEEELERYSLGEGTEEDCAWLEEHLLICEACRERLKEQDRYAGAMRRAAADWRAGHPPPRARRWSIWRLPALGAGICLVTAGALWLGWVSFQKNPAPALVGLSEASAARAPAGRPLHLQLDWSALARFPHYDLEVLNAAGQRVAQTVASPAMAARIPGLPPGLYSVRVSSPAGELLRQFNLAVAE